MMASLVKISIFENTSHITQKKLSNNYTKFKVMSSNSWGLVSFQLDEDKKLSIYISLNRRILPGIVLLDILLPKVVNWTKRKNIIVSQVFHLSKVSQNLKSHCLKISNLEMLNQKQPSTGVLRKTCLKICSKFTGEHSCRSVISKQLYWNHTSAWMFSCKFAAYFQNTYL